MNDNPNPQRTARMDDGADPALTVTRTDTAGGVELTATGEIDQETAPMLAEHLHRAIDDRDGRIVIDLGAVTFMDSSGVHALVTAFESALARLRLGRLIPAVRRVLELTALLDVFARAENLSSP
jgi:anti-anti-sigma factor